LTVKPVFRRATEAPAARAKSPAAAGRAGCAPFPHGRGSAAPRRVKRGIDEARAQTTRRRRRRSQTRDFDFALAIAAANQLSRATMSSASRVEHALSAIPSEIDRVGVLAMIAGTLITAWSGVLVRLIDVGPFAAGAWRVGLAAPALAALAKLVQRNQRDAAKAGRSARLLLFAGLAFALNIGFFHISLTGTKIANAAFIGAVGPIATVIGGALFFRERSSSRLWLAFGLSLLGAWTMAGLVAPAHIGFGDALALCSSITYSGYLLLIKQLRLRLDAVTATMWTSAISAVVLAVAAWLHGETMIPASAFGWMIAVLLGLGVHALGQGLTSMAMGRAPVGVIALVILAQPPFTALAAWTVLGETMTPLQFAGGAIILAALLLSSLPTASPSRRCAPSGTPRR
jgi:drug/metabolite transporter (DMT)-like permease